MIKEKELLDNQVAEINKLHEQNQALKKAHDEEKLVMQNDLKKLEDELDEKI